MSSPEIRARHRSAPRYGRFATTGLLLAGITAFVLAIITQGWSELTSTNFFWLAVLWLAPFFVGVGLVVAYLLDRRSIRRMT